MKKNKQINRVQKNQSTNEGFTMVELIAVIAIIGIISVIAINTYQNRSEDAKKTSAMHEMKEIANAEKTVETYYGYFVPMNVLNDLPSTPTGVSNADIISDHADFLIVEPTNGQNPPLGTVRTIRDMLAGRPTVSGDTVRTDKWKGPFLEFQKKTVPNIIGDEMPLDPWGGPYHFLSISNGDEIDDRGVVGGTGFSVNTIGRYAIVSWGRDSAQNTADDLFYTFQ